MTESAFSPNLLSLIPADSAAQVDHSTETPVEDLFEWGYCHALALALHELTEWPIVGLWSAGRSGGLDHYVVQRPDGALVDVRGAHAQDDLVADGYTMDGGHDPATLWAAGRDPDHHLENPDDVYLLARAVAEHLLRTI